MPTKRQTLQAAAFLDHSDPAPRHPCSCRACLHSERQSLSSTLCLRHQPSYQSTSSKHAASRRLLRTGLITHSSDAPKQRVILPRVRRDLPQVGRAELVVAHVGKPVHWHLGSGMPRRLQHMPQRVQPGAQAGIKLSRARGIAAPKVRRPVRKRAAGLRLRGTHQRRQQHVQQTCRCHFYASRCAESTAFLLPKLRPPVRLVCTVPVDICAATAASWTG